MGSSVVVALEFGDDRGSRADHPYRFPQVPDLALRHPLERDVKRTVTGPDRDVKGKEARPRPRVPELLHQSHPSDGSRDNSSLRRKRPMRAPAMSKWAGISP